MLEIYYSLARNCVTHSLRFIVVVRCVVDNFYGGVFADKSHSEHM